MVGVAHEKIKSANDAYYAERARAQGIHTLIKLSHLHRTGQPVSDRVLKNAVLAIVAAVFNDTNRDFARTARIAWALW